MTNEQLQNLALQLKTWFESKTNGLQEAADNVKDLEKLTIAINEDIELKLKTPEEVKAYRIGLLTAIGVLGEFPLEVVEKDKDG